MSRENPQAIAKSPLMWQVKRSRKWNETETIRHRLSYMNVILTPSKIHRRDKQKFKLALRNARRTSNGTTTRTRKLSLGNTPLGSILKSTELAIRNSTGLKKTKFLPTTSFALRMNGHCLTDFQPFRRNVLLKRQAGMVGLSC